MVGTKIKFKMLPRYPALERDISVTVGQDKEVDALRKCILKNGGKYIESAVLFDVYTGSNIEAGKKSLAYAISFRSKDKTLTDAEIDEDMKNIIASLGREFGAVLR